MGEGFDGWAVRRVERVVIDCLYVLFEGLARNYYFGVDRWMDCSKLDQ